MTKAHLVDTFESHPFLLSLNEHQRLILASGAQPFKVEDGDYLIREGEPADAFYLIQSGTAQIEAWQEAEEAVLPVEKVLAGDVVGWSWALTPYRWRFSCRAVESLQGIHFDAHWLRDLCETDCYLGYQLHKKMLEVLAHRLTALRRRQPALSAQTLEASGAF